MAIEETLNLKESIGKELYFVGSQPDGTGDAVPLYASTFKIDVRNYLNEIIVEPMDEIIAIHGVVTSAVSIPLEVPEEVDIFLVLKDATMEFDSYILPVETIQDLQEVVSYIAQEQYDEEDDISDDIIEYLADIECVDIEDMFVVYGRKLELIYSCDAKGTPYDETQKWKCIFNKIKMGQV